MWRQPDSGVSQNCGLHMKPHSVTGAQRVADDRDSQKGKGQTGAAPEWRSFFPVKLKEFTTDFAKCVLRSK